MDPDTGEATDDLQPQVIKMFQELGTKCTTVSQVIETEDRAVFKDIQDGIDRYNDSPSLNNAQKVLTTIFNVSTNLIMYTRYLVGD